ncbi:MAG: iron-containing alcohol dehydrogenase [bacterium]
MQPFDFQSSIRVVYGENTLNQLGNLSKVLGGERVLIVTDAGIVAAGLVERARQLLQHAAIDAFVFDGVETNPTTRHVEDGLQFAREIAPIDLIIGLGGGSAMDCAKGINFLLTNGGKMEDYWGVDKAAKPMLPSIGIPTTAGTGSEAQSFALIAQEEGHRKMACGDKKARFKTVILDPVLIRSVPQEIKATAGMDALAHAVESFVCTRSNAVSELFSREAWRLLSGNFEKMLKEPENLRAASRMLLGAHFAGMAVENAMLGAAHACANPLTARFGISHGMAVGLMLPSVVRFNSQVVEGRYQKLMQALNVYQTAASRSAEQLAEKLVDLMRKCNWPLQLSELHIAETDLPALAEEAAQQWTAQFNPRPLSPKVCLELYQKTF